MTRREVVARWLWCHDGLPATAWDTGAGLIACKRGPGGEMRREPRPQIELRETYLKAADELLAKLDVNDGGFETNVEGITAMHCEWCGYSLVLGIGMPYRRDETCPNDKRFIVPTDPSVIRVVPEAVLRQRMGRR